MEQTIKCKCGTEHSHHCNTCGMDMIKEAKLDLIEECIEKDEQGRVTFIPRVLFKVYEELQAERNEI